MAAFSTGNHSPLSEGLSGSGKVCERETVCVRERGREREHGGRWKGEETEITPFAVFLRPETPEFSNIRRWFGFLSPGSCEGQQNLAAEQLTRKDFPSEENLPITEG